MMKRFAVCWIISAVVVVTAGCAQHHSDDIEREGLAPNPASPALAAAYGENSTPPAAIPAAAGGRAL